AQRARSNSLREGAGGAPADPCAGARGAPQAALRNRRVRAGRRPRLRPGARGDRAARRPAPLSSAASSAMIEVAGLRVVRPPATVALHRVDLVVRPGEFVAILGRSGAGKTTFLRALTRLVHPTDATIRVAG